MVQVKCPRCNQAIKSKAGADLVYYCPECRVMHTRDQGGKVEYVDYEITGFDMVKEQALGTKPYQKVYMPFWRVLANINILHEEVAGGLISKMASMMAGGSRSGNVVIYLPAVELEAETFKYLATLLTTNPPVYRRIEKFEESADKLACTISKFEAEKLADFIVLSNEAEKPGVLQRLNYEMKIQGMQLVYLAYHRIDGNLVLAV